MDNYTRNTIIDGETGEIKDEYYSNNKDGKSYYHGPRKYWRLMELYDMAQKLIASRVGVDLMIYLKQHINTKTYRITINKTWLAEDIGSSRDAIIKNINKLVDNGYLISEERNQYFIHPGMYWSGNLDSNEWQELKKDYLSKLEVEAPVAS